MQVYNHGQISQQWGWGLWLWLLLGHKRLVLRPCQLLFTWMLGIMMDIQAQDAHHTLTLTWEIHVFEHGLRLPIASSSPNSLAKASHPCTGKHLYGGKSHIDAVGGSWDLSKHRILKRDELTKSDEVYTMILPRSRCCLFTISWSA